MVKINLGCGKDIKEGFVNIDKFAGKGVDILIDLEKQKLTEFYEPNSIDYIYSSHLLEHLNNPEDVFLDMLKIAKPDAIIEIRVPHFMRAKTKIIFHKRDFSLHSFEPFIKGFEESTSLETDDGFGIAKLAVLNRELHWMTFPSNKILVVLNRIVESIINSNYFMQRITEHYFGYLIGGFYEIYFMFKVVKD